MATLAARYAAAFPRSAARHDAARGLFPDGVTHDLRHLTPFPVVFDRAAGSRKVSIDGPEVVDYFSGHGALLLGHSHPAVVEAVREQVGRFTHAGGCHPGEVAWGELVRRLVPTAEKVRFVGSGTEATLMAIRLARIATGKSKLLKLVGHFHGWHDAALPGAYLPYDGTTPPGVPDAVAALTVTVPPNDLDAVEQALAADPDIGCVILEPTGGHWGKVPIRGPYLHALRDLTTRLGRLLIFDEVITGFRVAPGGAQAAYRVRPDLTTLAKIVAGGLPGGCVAGRADLLDHISHRPGRPKVRHPGTFNANPLSAAAGIAALEIVATGDPCRQATATAVELRSRLNALFGQGRHRWIAYGDFSLVHLLPGYDGPPANGDGFVPHGGSLAKLDGPKDVRMVHAFRQAMLLHGVDLPGLGLFLTAAHSAEDVERTVAAVAGSLEMLAAEGFA